MAKTHVIPITNGIGSIEIVDGEYNATANVAGYDNATLSPSTQTITEDVDTYEFTIQATGTLTLHVSDDGSEIGVPIVGATFYRCDAEGTTYGDVITTDDDGNAIFNNVPYSEESTGPTIYYKQTASDGEHTFVDTVQETTLEAETKTVEIENAVAATRTFKLTDASYEGLPIADGEITLEQ